MQNVGSTWLQHPRLQTRFVVSCPATRRSSSSLLRGRQGPGSSCRSGCEGQCACDAAGSLHGPKGHGLPANWFTLCTPFWGQTRIQAFCRKEPANVSWGKTGAEYLCMSTGVLTQKEKAELHLAGSLPLASRVTWLPGTSSPPEKILS